MQIICSGVDGIKVQLWEAITRYRTRISENGLRDRVGEMIRKVGGLGLGGPRGKGFPSISKGSKPPIQLL